jgi:hypothetical protein
LIVDLAAAEGYSMGLWAGILENLIDLKRRGFLGQNIRIAEIGPQQLTDNFLDAKALIKEVYQFF